MSEFTSTTDSGVYSIILWNRDDLIIEMPPIGRTKPLGLLSHVRWPVRRPKTPAYRWVVAFVAWLMAAFLQASEPGNDSASDARHEQGCA
jgi:hypothetical protein